MLIVSKYHVIKNVTGPKLNVNVCVSNINDVHDVDAELVKFFYGSIIFINIFTNIAMLCKMLLKMLLTLHYVNNIVLRAMLITFVLTIEVLY
jgi:hypothetical protein